MCASCCKTSHRTKASHQCPFNKLYTTPIARRNFSQDLICGPDVDERQLRHNLQDMTECPHCFALVWVQERTAGSRTRPLFSICCGKGQITIPQIMPYNKIMDLLRRKTFYQDIRKYNSAMAFASMRCNLDQTLANAKKGAFVFRISGQVMHSIGPVFPPSNKSPGFSQIYFYDPHQQATLRNKVFKNQLSIALLKDLEAWITPINPFSTVYKTMRQHEINSSHNLTFVLRGDIRSSTTNKELYGYNKPTSTEIAVLLPGSGDMFHGDRDILLETIESGSGRPFTRIWETHPSYDPLYYVLMHPAGEHGWTYKTYLKNSFRLNPFDYFHTDEYNIIQNAPTHTSLYTLGIANDIATSNTSDATYTNHTILDRINRNQQHRRHSNIDIDDIIESYGLPTAQDEDNIIPTEHGQETAFKFVSCREFYAYRLQMRPFSTYDRRCYLHMFGRLFQQYVVDQYAKVEGERLRWYRENQDDYLSAHFQGLADAYSANDGCTPADVSRSTILPSTFTGGPRHMQQQFQDAMGIVSRLGKPDLFITFTCNPKWPEITKYLLGGQTASDRPDLTTRVFAIKLKSLLDDLLLHDVLGKVIGWCWVIEFQKRGLPHCHILLILDPAHKPKTPADFDAIVSAELPDKHTHPLTYATVTRSMIHGPCGEDHKDSPCMVEGSNGKWYCSKGFPKPLRDTTIKQKDSYPLYRRRKGPYYINRRNQQVDNTWVVPYNAWLTTKYDAHINVEICSSIKAVKYLYKYVHKGHDRAMVTNSLFVVNHLLLYHRYFFFERL